MRSLGWFVRMCGAVVLSLAIAAGVRAQTSPTPPPHPQTPSAAMLIAAGRGIGAWTLDSTLQDLVFTLGPSEPHLSQPGPLIRNDLLWHEWSDPPLVVLVRATALEVQALGTVAAGYLTLERVGVGATTDQVQAAYGDPEIVVQPPLEPKVVIYNVRGLAFQFPYDAAKGYGPADQVWVFHPRQARAIWRLP